MSAKFLLFTVYIMFFYMCKYYLYVMFFNHTLIIFFKHSRDSRRPKNMVRAEIASKQNISSA